MVGGAATWDISDLFFHVRSSAPGRLSFCQSQHCRSHRWPVIRFNPFLCHRRQAGSCFPVRHLQWRWRQNNHIGRANQDNINLFFPTKLCTAVNIFGSVETETSTNGNFASSNAFLMYFIPATQFSSPGLTKIPIFASGLIFLIGRLGRQKATC